jgi:hypothetical protein
MEPRESSEIIEPRVNFEDIPISALRQKSRYDFTIRISNQNINKNFIS